MSRSGWAAFRLYCGGEAATIVVVAEEGPFAMQRVVREEVKGRMQIHLPAVSSSLPT